MSGNDTAEELEQLAVDGAERLVTALASDAWSAISQHFALLINKHKQRVEATRAKLAETVDTDRRAATSEREVAAWTTRLRDALQDDPSLIDYLRQALVVTASTGIAQTAPVTRVGMTSARHGRARASGHAVVNQVNAPQAKEVYSARTVHVDKSRHFRITTPFAILFNWTRQAVKAHPVIAAITATVVVAGTSGGVVAAVSGSEPKTPTGTHNRLAAPKLTTAPPSDPQPTSETSSPSAYSTPGLDMVYVTDPGGDRWQEIIQIKPKESESSESFGDQAQSCLGSQAPDPNLNVIVPINVEMTAITTTPMDQVPLTIAIPATSGLTGTVLYKSSDGTYSCSTPGQPEFNVDIKHIFPTMVDAYLVFQAAITSNGSLSTGFNSAKFSVDSGPAGNQNQIHPAAGDTIDLCGSDSSSGESAPVFDVSGATTATPAACSLQN